MGQFTVAQVSKEELQSISTPDSVQTPIGTLKFFDGVPTDDTVKKVYDNLDRMPGVQVFLNTLPGASMYRLRAANKKIGQARSNVEDLGAIGPDKGKGGKYLVLPPGHKGDIPAGKDFPSISSYKDLKKNSDGSVDLYLGPKAPEGYEKNFIRTLYPAKVTSSSTDSMVRLSRTSIKPGNSMI